MQDNIPNQQHIKDYAQWDSKYRSLSFQQPAGFTGQGCLWFATTAPTGWLLCDGSLVNKEDYPALWLLLGDTWGASTSTQFYLPDLRQRVPVGKHTTGTFAALNNSGGAETHTLSSAEMPAHSHNIRTADNGYTIGVSGSYAAGGTEAMRRTATADMIVAQNTGGGGAHNNLQPYRVVNFIIKI